MSLHSVGSIKSITLNPSQARFLMNWERVLALFGGVGNGKTTIAILKVIEIMKTFPRSRGVICRKTWPDLEASTMEEFFTLCPPELIDSQGTRKSAGSPQCKFKNGSTVLFRHLVDRGGASTAKQRLSNLNLNFVLIDQAEEVEESWIELFRGRLRRVVHDAKGRRCPHQLMLIGNMAGRNYVWRRFVRDKLKNHEIIVASTLENKENLPPDYLEDLLSAPKHWVNRYVYGSWDDYEGLILSEFSRPIHEIERFEIPPNWPRFRSIDHGIVRPTTCGWWALDKASNVYLYQIYYEPDRLIREHVWSIMSMSRDDAEVGYRLTTYDPAVFYKIHQNDDGKYDDYSEYLNYSHAYINKHPELREVGLWGVPGNNDFRAGVGRLNDYAAVDNDHTHPITGDKGSPHIFIFEGCEAWWAEQGDYTWKPPKGGFDINSVAPLPEQEDPSKPNHAMDMSRYFIMNQPPLHALKEIVRVEKKERDGWERTESRRRNWKVA